MSLAFSKLTPSFQADIDDFLSKTGYETSDYCLASVLFFTELDDIEASRDDIALYIKCVYNDETMFFSPLCEEKDYAKAIQVLKNYCYENDIVLKFYATKSNVKLLLQNEKLSDEEIDELFTHQHFKTEHFCFENDRDSADYIFRPEKLINLSGNAYKSKRSEIKAFEKAYGGRYEIRDMLDEDIPGILKLVKVWHKFKEFSENDETERLAEIIKNREQLHINVVVLLVDGEIVATSIYSVLKSNVGDEIFERCNPDFRNAYAIMGRYVATKLQECNYINFEEDMGIEGLRFSKSSYKPEYLLEKFIVNENLDNELKQIYQDIFGDGDEFTEEIFSEHCQCSCTSLDIADKKVVACGFYRKKQIRILDKIYELPFLFAIGTDKNYRYQGRAKRIITRLLNIINDRKFGFVALYPFPVARSFYEKMGFVTFNYTREKMLKDVLLADTEFKFESEPDAQIFTDVFNNSCVDFNLTQYRELKDTEKMLNEAKCYGGKILTFLHNGECYGYVIKSDEEVEEVIVNVNYEKEVGDEEKFNINNCDDNVREFLNEKVLICSNKPVATQISNADGYTPYIMLRVVDSYQFVKSFLPFIIPSPENKSINIFVSDDMIGNSIINLNICDGVVSVHANPDEDSQANIYVNSTELCHWALGEIQIEGLPAIDSQKIITKYKDTY